MESILKEQIHKKLVYTLKDGYIYNIHIPYTGNVNVILINTGYTVQTETQ